MATLILNRPADDWPRAGFNPEHSRSHLGGYGRTVSSFTAGGQ